MTHTLYTVGLVVPIEVFIVFDAVFLKLYVHGFSECIVIAPQIMGLSYHVDEREDHNVTLVKICCNKK